MKIISDFSKDTQTQKPKPGSYEWWYFDAMEINGYSFVIIFYEGNPFSRRYIRSIESGEKNIAKFYPAISISVYKQDEPIFYSLREFHKDEAGFRVDAPSGKVGNNFFEGKNTGSEINYHIMLNQFLPNGDAIKANLTFRSEKIDGLQLIDDENDPDSSQHTWNLVQPKCKVEGNIEISGYKPEKIEFEGTGYHDHNIGFEPMKDSFTEWYWGRYHTKNETILYYLMNKSGTWDKKAWMISDDGNVLPLNEHPELENKGFNSFGLKTARTIDFAGKDTEVFIQKDKLLDDGPFYQRWKGKLILNKNGVLVQAEGISEYIYPSRIYQKMFWPLVNMRIQYPGKPHWVQKKQVLYRWTW